MDYISVKEAAEKWNVSKRLVQKYCSSGRIDGVRKFSGSWEIPINAPKPQDPRKNISALSAPFYKTDNDPFSDLMPLMNTSFNPGECTACITKIKDPQKHAIALAEFHYFSGHPQKAAQEAELYLTCNNPALRLSACLIYGYANLSIGQIHLAKYALAEIKNTLASTDTKTLHLKAMEAFATITAYVLLHIPLPEDLPPINDLLPELPIGIRMFALYVYAHYLYLNKQYQKSIGIAQATFAMVGKQQYPIPAIYLHLVLVMDYMSLKETELAKKHLLTAWDIARPDDLIEGFGEHHGLLGGMLEAVIKPNWPLDFKRIISITYSFSHGWRKIHNPVTGHIVADNLTTTEFATAMLAARGWTNQEIGDHMNISHNTVKKHISTAMGKLGITRRQDLKKYMLQ